MKTEQKPHQLAESFHQKHAVSLPEIFNVLRRLLPSLRTTYGVHALGVFGSYIREEQRPDSDLDVLVEFEPDQMPNLLRFVQLEQELAANLGLNVDLVLRNTLKPNIGRNILREVVLV